MILFHGSNAEIEQVDLSKCRPFKDFGRGFYLTTMRTQAEAMARRTTKIQGEGEPLVTVFELADMWKDTGLSVLEFASPCREWADFVINNRNRSFTDVLSPRCNRCNQYDIVVGPVADDAIVASFQLYQDGRISMDELVERLRYRKLTDQYSFHTYAALELLTNLGVRP